jgi:hypothetical protein
MNEGRETRNAALCGSEVYRARRWFRAALVMSPSVTYDGSHTTLSIAL